MKKCFYKVFSMYWGDGNPIAKVSSVYTDQKPQNKYHSLSTVDVYEDYFDNLEDAENFARNVATN